MMDRVPSVPLICEMDAPLVKQHLFQRNWLI
jgi:hypothetical protein